PLNLKFSGDLGKSVQRPTEILAGGVFFFSKQWRRQRCFIDPFGATVLRRVQKAIRGAWFFQLQKNQGKHREGEGRIPTDKSCRGWDGGSAKVPTEKSAHSTGEKTSGDWRNSDAGFSWSDRNKGRWICKSRKLLGRVHIGINLRGADSRAAVLQYGEKKLQEILDPMLKAAKTADEEDDSSVFGAGCRKKRLIGKVIFAEDFG
ncbi:hypothetical protein U1Q18_047954, partial [Sarracenia purpurea var. burkii]